MSTIAPRAVFVTRETDYELLLARHATREQARFFLETRGQSLAEVERRHERFAAVLHAARGAVPADWRQALVRRADFDRFLFAPEDLVVAVGQDGLVANVAKYLSGQHVLGVNPDPDQYDGILVRLSAEGLGASLRRSLAGEAALERRTMVAAVLDGGERLLALNEVFVGHRSHQSARYETSVQGRQEFQSSSGLIVSSGTGATGWARSIMEATGESIPLGPEDRALGYFVREAFPSISTATNLTQGLLAEEEVLEVVSEMNESGVIFGDGIEDDRLAFPWGKRARIAVSSRRLALAA